MDSLAVVRALTHTVFVKLVWEIARLLFTLTVGVSIQMSRTVWENYGFLRSSEPLRSNISKLQSLRPDQFFELLQTDFKRDLHNA